MGCAALEAAATVSVGADEELDEVAHMEEEEEELLTMEWHLGEQNRRIGFEPVI